MLSVPPESPRSFAVHEYDLQPATAAGRGDSALSLRGQKAAAHALDAAVRQGLGAPEAATRVPPGPWRVRSCRGLPRPDYEIARGVPNRRHLEACGCGSGTCGG